MFNISDKTLFCFRKLERVKRVENRNKFKEIKRQNKIVADYFQKWKKIVFSGIFERKNINLYLIILM